MENPKAAAQGESKGSKSSTSVGRRREWYTEKEGDLGGEE